MDATLSIEQRRCCLCHRILLSDSAPVSGGVLETMSICGDCKFLFVEDTNTLTQHTTPTTRYNNSSLESIENILSQEFPDMINLSRNMQPVVFDHGNQFVDHLHTNFSGLRQWSRVLSDTESDGFDATSYDIDTDTDSDENTHGSLTSGARLHRSLATNGRNLPSDWLREVLSPDSGIGISERRGIDGNLEEQVTWRNAVEYLDGEMDRGALAPPASADFVKNLERVVVDDDDVAEGLVCVICKESVCVGSVVNRLPCLHVYHASCIVPWLNAHNTCPLCRYKLPTDCDSWRPNRRFALVEESENVSGGGWWFVVAPLVSVVGIGVMLWLGRSGSCGSRRWWGLL